MPNNNGKNEKNLNASNQNSGAAARRQLRAQKLKAKQLSSKKTYRVVNSGKFEHLRKQVAEFKKNRDEYIRMQNRKMAQEMAQQMVQQNNEPKKEPVIEQVNQKKPETEIKNENTVVIEEPKAKEVPQNEVAEEKDSETLNLEDIKIDESELDDPALDEELEKLEQEMKKEEELKAQGIDPESVKDLDDPELEKELGELAQGTEEKLEGDALEEAFQKLSNEVDGEIKGSHADDLEVNDPVVNEEINRLEQEIAAEGKVNNAPENKEEAPKEEIKEENEMKVENQPVVEELKEEVQTEPQVAEPEKEPEPQPISMPVVPEELQIDTEEAEKNNDLIIDNFVENVFAGAKAELEEEQRKNNEIVNNFVENVFAGAKAEVQDIDELLGEEAEVISDVPKNEQPEQPVASDEERKEREIAFAKQALEALSKHRGGLTEEKRDRENLRSYYQGILDKYKTDEDWYNESLAQAEQKRQEQREREAREKELKEQAENSGIRDIIEDEAKRDAVAGEENDTNLLADENPAQEAIYIPDFYERLNGRFGNNDVTKQVMSELTAIIQSAGIEDQQTASDIAELVYFNVAEGLKTSYIEGGFRPKTRDAVETCFDNADTALKLRDDTGLNLEERLVVAQRITNVMFKNYSPVTFADHKLDYYAEDYVLKDDALLRKQLSDHYKISQDQIEPMMQNIRAKLEGRTVNKQAEPDALLNPEVKENHAQETAPKQEPAPKQNAQVQNAMDDFFGADDLIDGSKPDAFERKLAEQKAKEAQAKEEQAKKAQEKKVQEQPAIVNAFDDDDFIAGDKPDAFERKLAEQEAKEAVKKEAEKKAAEEAAKKAAKEAQKLEESKQRENSVRANVFINNLKTFNGMYKVNLEPNNFALTVSDAWTLIRSGDDKKKADGQKMLGELFKSAIKPAFEIEKHASYNEHRLPDYTEIAKSANELLRSAMYGFTDMYHSPNTKDLFDATALGGLNAKDIVALTEGESQWSMDQKSDEAWEIQSKDAKNLADKWLSGDKPYEKMISEMKALAKADKDGVVDRKEILTKLTAAEWLLVNNDKMMIDDPEDPLNKLPNWGNRYWKALTEAREALGIDKHTSMRDLIQSDYAASAKAVISSAYNEAQIEDYVLDSAAREIYDSMEIQKEQFATQSAAVTLTDSQIDKNAEEIEMTGVRFPHPVPELDERTIMQHQPKNYDFVIEPQTELNLTAKNQTQAK